MKILFKPALKSIAVLFAALLLSQHGIAQGPNSPEAASFEPVDATDMVDLLTGDFTYVMPLLNVPSPEGGYPLALAYHAGIAMEQDASWVGLGWSLNPGAINRNINGYPDDWRTGTVKDFAYDNGGSEYSSAVSIGYGVPGKWSVGIGVSWGSNRSMGGSINGSLGMVQASVGTDGVSVGVGVSNNLSISASYGYDGSVGLSASFFTSSSSSVGFSLGIQTGPNGVSGSFGVDSRSFLLDANTVARSSIGISLSSSGASMNSTIAGFSTGAQTNSNTSIAPSDYQITELSTAFAITTPWGYLSYGKNSISWRLRTITRTHVDGAINPYANYEQSTEYRGNDFGMAPTVTNARSMDVFEINTKSAFEQNQQASYLDSNNGVLSNFDNYVVNAQGIGGSISPTIGNNIMLYPLVHSGEHKQGYFVEYDADVNALGKVNQYQGYRPPINFNFQSHGESYLNVLPYNMTYSAGQGVLYNVPSPSLPSNFSYNSQQKISYHNSSYNLTGNRKKESNFIQYYTVEEINSGSAAANGFLDVDNNFARTLTAVGYGDGLTNNISSQLYLHQNFQAGIAAFKITAADGKTYHYSLPVYQGEQVRRLFGIVDNKTEDQAHIDRMNFNPFATHWLLTAITGPDYLKTDPNRKFPDEGDLGYWVRFDYGKWSNGHIWKSAIEPVDVFGKVKEYTWGRKQIYYLDKVKTRTHTAVFIKDLRSDGKSAAHVYKNMFHNITGSNAFMQMDANPLLRLNKIILLKNEDANTLNKAGGAPLTSVKSYDYYTSGDFNRHIDNLGTLQGWETPGNEHRKTFQANLSNNVFDLNDLVNTNIETKSIKTIKFTSDYSLCQNAPNSGSGKLTLKSVSFLGRSGANVIPPTKFEYSNKPYNKSKENDFGYYLDSPETWSLNKIITPIGANINIVYEPDSYKKTAIKNARVFTSKLKFSFIIPPPPSGANPEFAPEGLTRIKIQVDDMDPSANGLVLSDYFNPGEPFFMDMWYSAIYNHSSAGYDRSSVNINSKMATIIELNTSQNYMVVDVLASSPNFRDVFQSSAEPVSVLHAGNHYAGIENQNLPRYELAWTPNSGWRKYSMRHTIIANKDKSHNNAGIRVKRIIINEQGGANYYTYYDYNDPATGQSSGIIPYYPEKNYNIKQQVPFISVLPGPVVTYEYVREYNGQVSKLFKFKVLKELTTIGNTDNFGDLLSIERTESNPTAIINLKNMKIRNNLSALGRIESITISNTAGHILNKTTHNYKQIPVNFGLGQYQQAYFTSKDIRDHYTFGEQYNIKEFHNVTTVLNTFSSLESTETIEKGHKNKIIFSQRDLLTGQVVETLGTASDGNLFKTKIVPAFSKYPEMGSKADNINNRNMLTQTAAEYRYIMDGAAWKESSIGITTWNKEWTYLDIGGGSSAPTLNAEKIWRKHRSYIWNGDKDGNGIFLNYNSNDENWLWTGVGIQPAVWKLISEVSLYDRYSMAIEAKDINGLKITNKMGDNDSKIITSGNAGYNEIFYAGGEYIKNLGGVNYLEPEVKILGGAGRTAINSIYHTGSYAIRTAPGQKFGVDMNASQHRAGKYKLSVWVYNGGTNQDENSRIIENGSSSQFNGESVKAGQWTLKTHYFNCTTAASSIYVSSAVGDVIYDDLMIRPIASSFSGYVYDKWDQLTHIIGNNGLSVKFVYDEAGRLKETYTEVADDPLNGVSGGFKLKSRNTIYYKNL